MTQNCLGVLGFEVVQSIQTLDHSVPLLASKRTAVRCYIRPNVKEDMNVRGILHVTANGKVKSVASHNIVQIRHAGHPDKDTQRGDLFHSFLFVLNEADVSAGHATLKLAAAETLAGSPLEIDPMNNHGSFKILEGPTLRIHAVGIRIRVLKQDPELYPPGSEYYFKVPEQNDFDAIRSFIMRSFPVSNLEWSQTIIDAPADFTPPFRRDEYNEIQNAEFWAKKYAVLAACLYALRAQGTLNGTDPRTHYYGLVPDVSFDGAAANVPVTPRPDTISIGPATGEGELAAHELGHTFGGLHIGNDFGCYHEEPGEEGHDGEKDPNYPDAYRGFLSGPKETAHGFDLGDGIDGPRVLRFDEYHDLMGYCVPRWPSLYNYLNFLRRITSEDILHRDPESPYLHVIGTYDQRKNQESGKILYVMRVMNDPIGVIPSGPAEVIAYDNANNETGRSAVEPRNPLAKDLPNSIAAFQVFIPITTMPEKLELRLGGKVVDTYTSLPIGPVAHSTRLKKGHI